MKPNDIFMSIGFLLEICFFMLAGYFIFVVPLRGFMFLVLGIVVAYIVGRSIAKNTIEKYQEDLK